MAKRFYLAVAPLLLIWVTSCAAPSEDTPPQEPAASPPQESDSEMLARLRRLQNMRQEEIIADLAGLQTVDEMRVCLRNGLEKNELHFVGFDQVTVAECIDQVVAAAMHDRSKPGNQETRARLVESLDIYFAALDEARIRRGAGAAPCLPYMNHQAR